MKELLDAGFTVGQAHSLLIGGCLVIGLWVVFMVVWLVEHRPTPRPRASHNLCKCDSCMELPHGN